MKLLRRLRALFRKDTLDREMSEEMRHHLELQIEANLAKGMDPDEARYAAQRCFGGVEQIKEKVRDQWGWRWLDETAQDLRYGARTLRKTPGFTLAAVLTLALGIGVNAALFAVLDIMTLRPLPSRSPEELVDIFGFNEQLGGGNKRFSYPDYLDYCAGTQAFSGLAVMTEMLGRLPEEDSGLQLMAFQTVSGNYLSTVGAGIILGRDFLPEEAGPHAGQPVIVISHSFWQNHLEGDPNVLGRTLTVQDARGPGRTVYTVIGVAAPEFVGQMVVPPTGWIPLTAKPEALQNRSERYLSLIGRMRAGVSPGQAKADLDLITQQLARVHPEKWRANAVQLTPGMMVLNPSKDTGLLLAMSPVLIGFVLVLVIACLNVANLLLARGVARQHEVGVRLVLGASRGRIIRQLFAENVLLCALGAAGALLFAVWALKAFRLLVLSMIGDPVIRNVVGTISIELDWRILGFAAILAAVAGLTSGLMPALHSVRRNGLFALKHEGTAFGRKLTPSRLRSLLLIGQVAVCMTLLAVSGIMTGKMLQSSRGDPGFSTDQVYQVNSAALSGDGSLLFNDPLGAVETLGTLPGVAAAGMVANTPLRKPGNNLSTVRVKTAGKDAVRLRYNQASAGLLKTFNVPVQRGRFFTLHETATDAPVVVVSESAARALWPGQEAVGQFLAIEAGLFDHNVGPDAATPNLNYRDCEVIGIVADIRSNYTGDDSVQMMWLPLPAKEAAADLFVRVQADSPAVLRSVEQAAAAAGMRIQFVERLGTITDRGLAPLRAFAWISSALSILSLVLAVVGLYGVMSFGVNQRVKEIGVRMALGATTARVIGLFVRQGMRLVAWGVALGLLGGTAFAVLLTKALPGAHFASDQTFCGAVFAVVTVLLTSISLVACWLPSRRAARVDPMIALRCE